MNILSYRGPSTPGGVSATLSRVIEQTETTQRWWYLHGSQLRKKLGKQNSIDDVCQIPFKIVEGHYRFCNKFLWPVLHELSEFASFDEADKNMYEQLNLSFAWNVRHTEELGANTKTFVNDYQLALCPKYLSEHSSGKIDLFWHIPWPKYVKDSFAPHLCQIAEGLLHSHKIGFHIDCYGQNFLNFVHQYMPAYKVHFAAGLITKPDGGTVSIVCHPLGVDSDYWLNKLREESYSCRDVDVESFSKKPFVLSVDRADYTKGVFQRLSAIEHFFSTNSDKMEKVTFLQLCQKTRAGLPAYDEYWNKCKTLCESINSRWGSSDWQPIVWIDTPVSANVLAWLYKRAEVMLVTPVLDGLNLTAKEFALCSKDGTLILSKHAGAWRELSDNVLTLNDLEPETISKQIATALSTPKIKRKERMDGLKQTVLANSLGNWWQKFGGELRRTEKVVALSHKLHHNTRREMWIAK